MLPQFTDYKEKIKYHGVRVPEIDNIDSTVSEKEFLTRLCREGFTRLKLNSNPRKKEYVDRVKIEIETLDELGFTGYILLVWDLINWCREKGIPTGPARGSCAGSLVLYLIDVTKLDPIEHGLYFERFVNKTRARSKIVDGELYLDGSLIADIDLDISFVRRHEVIEEYLNNKYKEKNSKILTFSSYSSKVCIKEVAKLYGHSESEMNEITRSIETVYGTPRTLEECYSGDEEKGILVNDQFKNWADYNKKTFLIAKSIEGLIKNYGVHASGYILSYDPLIEEMPYQMTKDNEIISGFDMKSALEISIKLDLLGLRTLDIINQTADEVGLDLSTIDYNDPFIYECLQDLKYPYGLFQIEGDTGFKTIQKIKPKRFHDISAVLAIARPGALQFAGKYARYVESGEYESLHPELDEVLKETAGTVLYQEQIMRIMSEVLKFSLIDGENIRRIVGKKKVEEMAEWKDKIFNKVKENGQDIELAEIFWKILDDSSKYSFNLSHSISYSLLTVYTIYLKFKYPLQFFKNLLCFSKYEQKPQECVGAITRELDKFNIKLLPPSLKKSKSDFSVEGDAIRCGIGNLRGISDKALEKISEFNLNADSKFSLFECIEQSKFNITTFVSLIRSGCFDEFLKSSKERETLVLEAKCWNALTKKEKNLLLANEIYSKYKENLILILKDCRDGKNELMSEKRWGTFSKKVEKAKMEFMEYSKNLDLQIYLNEYNVLGFSFTYHLVDIIKQNYANAVKIGDINSHDGDGEFILGGIVKDFAEKKTKKGKKFIRMICCDESGEILCTAFESNGKGGEWGSPDNIQIIRENNGGKLPKDGCIVAIKGKKKHESPFFSIDNLKILS